MSSFDDYIKESNTTQASRNTDIFEPRLNKKQISHHIGSFTSSKTLPNQALDRRYSPQFYTNFESSLINHLKDSKRVFEYKSARDDFQDSDTQDEESEAEHSVATSTEDLTEDEDEEFFSAQGSPTALSAAESKSIVDLIEKTNHKVILVLPNSVRSKNFQAPDGLEEFIKNREMDFDNEDFHKEAARRLRKIQALGGLRTDKTVHVVNIPEARMGLCILAQLNDHKLKMEALDSLYELLRNDTLDTNGAIELVSLTIKFLRNMNRDQFQREIIDVQIKIAKVCSALAKLLKRQYTQKHINAITEELKNELIHTTKSLKDINTQENDELAFHVNCALQGIRYLKDDSKSLHTVLNRIYKVGAGITVITQGADNGFEQINEAFANLDPHLKKNWYKLTLVIEDLAKEAIKDKMQLTALLIAIHNNYKKTNWKYSYAAITILSEIALKGSTEEIRRLAFTGIDELDFPGLSAFCQMKKLSKYISFKPMLNFHLPKRRDPNTRIRYSSIEKLIKLEQSSSDKTLRDDVHRHLSQCSLMETDSEIRQLLNTHLSKTEENTEKSIKEKHV